MTFTAAYESTKPAWRNGLARWTSNPKVVGSTPTVGVIFCIAGYVLCSSNNSGRIIGVVQFMMTFFQLEISFRGAIGYRVRLLTERLVVQAPSYFHFSRRNKCFVCVF